METSGGRCSGDPNAPRSSGQVQTCARTSWVGQRMPWMACLFALFPYYSFLWPDNRIIDGLDYGYYQLPVHQFVRSELLHGRFPLWMPSLGCGTPLHAAQQAAVTYPLLTPFLLLFSANYGLRFALVFNAALGYCGQYLLARRLGLAPSASAFAAVVFTLSAYPVTHLLAGHVNLLTAYGLLPWFFLALMRLSARPGPRAAAVLALATSLLLLTGHPQLPYYTLLFGALWGFGSLAMGVAARHRLPVLAWAVAAGIVAGLLVSIQWLPWLELFRDGRAFSNRGSTKYSAEYALLPQQVLLFIFPDAWGNPYDGIPSREHVWFLYHEKACYVGLVTLGLILVGLVRRHRYFWQLPVLVLCGFSLILATAGHLPIYRLVSRLLPGYTQFRNPTRVVALLCFLAPLLAASGLEAVLNRETLVCGRWARRILPCLGLLACCAAALAFGRVNKSSHYDYYDYARTFLIWPLYRTALLVTVSLAATGVAWVLARRSATAGAAIMIGVVFLDLYATQAHLIGLTKPGAAEWGFIRPPPTRGRFTITPANAVSLRYSPLVGLLGDGTLSGVVTNEGGVLPASLARLHAGLADPERRDMVERLAACDLLYDMDQRTWFPLTNGLGRVRLAGKLDAQALRGEGRFRDLSSGTGSVQVLRETSQHILIKVDTQNPSLLIVADCYYPGWAAKVDGRAVPVECVHGSFRAVVVPAGTHQVEMAYACSPFRWGVAGTLAGLLLVVLLFLQGGSPGAETTRVVAHHE